MKLAMDIIPVISAGELQRRTQISARIDRDYRAQNINKLRQKVYCGLRRLTVFLLGAIIVALVLTHRDEIARATAQKMRTIASHVQKKDESSELRKSALTYEKEVNEVVGN
jgi:hypothetical protein